MKPRNKLIGMFMALVMTFQLVCLSAPAAHAADGIVSDDVPTYQFTDVSPDSAWYDAVYSLVREGVLNGVESDRFAPYEYITARQVIVTAHRLLGHEVSGEYFSGDMVNEAIGGLVLPVSLNADVPLTLQQAVNVLFRALGCLPACNSVAETLCSENRTFDFAVNVLTDLGVISSLHIDSARRNELITRGEYALLLDGCLSLLSDVNRSMLLITPGFGYIPINVTEKYQKDVVRTVGYMMNVPFNILRSYHNSEYTVTLDDEYIKSYSKEHPEYFNVVGLFVTSQKTIFMTTPFAVMHEMGHFAERFMVGVGDIEPCYLAEKDSCSDLLGSYAETNHREFFGEAFRFFIQEREDVMQMDLMRGVMPKTYQYFLDLEANDFVKPQG